MAVRGVNIGDLRRMPVPLPTLERQRQAVSQIERSLSLIATAAVEIDAGLSRSLTLRRSILASGIFWTPCRSRSGRRASLNIALPHRLRADFNGRHERCPNRQAKSDKPDQ